MTYETTFWIAAVLLSAVAVFAVLWALLRKTTNDDARLGKELAREALAEQLRVLQEERAAGLVTDKIYEASVTDVQRRALEELDDIEQMRSSKAPMGKVFAFGVSAAMVLSVFGLYKVLGSPSLINFVSEPPKAGIMQADGTLGSTEGLYNEESLAAYLKDNDKDERAWVLYARLKVREKSWPQAAQAYKRAVDIGELVAKDPDVLVEYAAALISQETEKTYLESLGVLDRVLSINDKHLPAHELYAISSLELEHWSAARQHLEFLLSQMSMDDPVYQRLAQTAAYAAQQERREAKNAQSK